MAAKSTDWRPGPTVCRCCLSEGCYKDISTEYFWMGKREVYAEMLLDSLNLSISYSQSGGPNSNSRLICEPCISRLRDASDFKRQVQECEKTFTQYLDPGNPSISFEEVPLEALDPQVKVERVKVERGDDSDDDFDARADFDDDDDDMDDQPLTKLASKIPKKESVDLLDLLDNAKGAVKRKSSTKTKPTPTKKSKTTTKKEVKATSSKSVKIEKKKGSITAVTESIVDEKPTKLKENVSERTLQRRRRANNELPLNVAKRLDIHMMRRNALVILEYSTALPFRWCKGIFYCLYCDEEFTEMDYLRQHFSNEHLDDQPSNTFFSKLKANNRLKIDVTHLSCKLCQCRLECIDDLKQHILACHGKELETVEYGDGVMPFKITANDVSCAYPKCSAVFNTIAQANQHMNAHYQNHVCQECGKAFATIPRLRIHVQSHEVGQFPCGECDEILKTRAQRYRHKLDIHKNGARYACPKCEQAFKSYYSRGKHLIEDHGDTNIEHNCSACNRTFATSSRRAKHFFTVHTHRVKKPRRSTIITSLKI